MVQSRKWMVALVTVAFMAAVLLTMLGPGSVGPGPAFAPGGTPPPPPPAPEKCNAGNGNGNEGCDPGNSAPQNKGGDEIGCLPPGEESGGSTPNPGGNNVEC